MIAQGLGGLTKTNLIILFALGAMIFLRSTLYTIDFSTIYLIISYDKSQGEIIPYPSYWIVFRGIIAPIVNIIELTMICYLVYHQDKRNKVRKPTQMKKALKGHNKNERKKEEFFMHVDMNEDEKAASKSILTLE